MESCIPVFLGGSAIVCAGFVVEDLEVYFMSAFLDAPTDGAVGVKAVAFVLLAEGFE